ncbi:hypothetical protein HDU99_000868 [Rhizoclosmatium hyalinum]|nr:hypothetical protein HDU99_000868 [Rhizoclosmatium hyalinum]
MHKRKNTASAKGEKGPKAQLLRGSAGSATLSSHPNLLNDRLTTAKDQQKTGGFGSLFAIVGSIASSVAIVMVNKHVLGGGFPFASTLTALHQLFCFIFTNVLIAAGVVPPLPPSKPSQYVTRVFVSLLYAGGLVLMNQSLALNSVTVYQLLKMSCIPTIAILQFFLYDKRLSVTTTLALTLILLGVFISTSSESIADDSAASSRKFQSFSSTVYNPSNSIGDNVLVLIQTFSPVLIAVLAVFCTSLSQILLAATPELKKLSSLQSIAALSFFSFLVCGTSAIAIDVGIYPGDWIRLALSLSGVSHVLFRLVPNGFEWLLFSGQDLTSVKLAAADMGEGHDFHEFLGGLSSRAYLTEHILGKFVSFLTKVSSGGAAGGAVIGWVVVSCLLAVLANLFGIAVIKESSAITFQVVGHVKTVLTLLVGAVLFGSNGLSGMKGVGVLVAFIGIIMYSLI